MRRRERWRNSSIATRAWRTAERRVVLRGFWGRLLIAVEPLAIALFFVALCVCLLVRQQEGAIFIAPIFGVAALAFLAYAAILMIPPARALLETFGSVRIVDGYVRYRELVVANRDIRYFVAVLDEERSVLAEWPLRERPRALDRAERWPALVEYTPYGGIHRIDGRSTGTLPDELPAFGVGAAADYGRKQPASSAPPRVPDL
jgi:hypothetical protein